jgi:hypothetical protein
MKLPSAGDKGVRWIDADHFRHKNKVYAVDIHGKVKLVKAVERCQ